MGARDHLSLQAVALQLQQVHCYGHTAPAWAYWVSAPARVSPRQWEESIHPHSQLHYAGEYQPNLPQTDQVTGSIYEEHQAVKAHEYCTQVQTQTFPRKPDTAYRNVRSTSTYLMVSNCMKNNSKSWSMPGLHNMFSSHHRVATNEVLHVVNVHDPTAALQATVKFLSIKQQRVLPGTVFQTLQKKELHHHVILIQLPDVRAQRMHQVTAPLQSNAVLEPTMALLSIRQQGIHLPRVGPEKRQKENRKNGVITSLMVKVLLLQHAQQHMFCTQPGH